MKLTLLLSLLLLFSCTKDNKTCYQCHIWGQGTDKNEKICTDGEEPGEFKDAQGNDLNSYCEKL